MSYSEFRTLCYGTDLSRRFGELTGRNTWHGPYEALALAMTITVATLTWFEVPRLKSRDRCYSLEVLAQRLVVFKTAILGLLACFYPVRFVHTSATRKSYSEFGTMKQGISHY